MDSWSFLSNHGRVLLFLAHDPGMRLYDIAASLGVSERSAYGIVADLTAGGYISRHKDGRRHRYQNQAHQPLPEPISRERAFGEVLALFPGAGAGQPSAEGGTAEPAAPRRCMRSGQVSQQAACSASI